MKDTTKLLSRGGIEVVAIVIGISLSFWTENTRKHNAILAEEKAALIRIHEDLVQDSLTVSNIVKWNKNTIKAMNWLIDHVNGDTVLSSRTIGRIFVGMNFINYPPPNNAGYENLVRNVGYRVIQKDTVAMALSAIYDDRYNHFNLLMDAFKIYLPTLEKDFMDAGGYANYSKKVRTKKLAPFDIMAKKVLSNDRFLRRFEDWLGKYMWINGQYEYSLRYYRNVIGIVEDYQDDGLLNDSIKPEEKE